MKTNVKPMTKWLLTLVFALVVISLILIPSVLKVESHADYDRGDLNEGETVHYIYTARQLAQLLARTWNNDTKKNNDNCWTGHTFYLMNDIDLRPAGSDGLTADSNGYTTQPVPSNVATSTGQYTGSGSYTRPANATGTYSKRFDKSNGYIMTFAGTFDGQGHTIRGIYNYKNTGGGARWQGILFDRVSGTIKNLRLSDCMLDWDQPYGNGGSTSMGAIAAGLTGTGVIENCVVDNSVWLISHRTDVNDHVQYIGGITGWNAGTVKNCTSFVNVISTTGQNFLSYPNASAEIQVGGVTGQIESSGKITNCIGVPTIYGNVTARNITSVDTGSTNPGWNWVTPAKSGSSWSVSNVQQGANTSLPYSGWVYYSPMKTYVPGEAVYNRAGNSGGGLFEVDAAIGNYSTKLRGSSYKITSAADFNTMITKINGDSSYGEHMVFKLTTNIDLNPGWNSHPTVSGGMVTSWPSAPTNVYDMMNNFKGTLDGQNYTLSGIYRVTTVNANWQSRGLLFAEFAGTMKNIAITNSYSRCTNTAGYGSLNFYVGGIAGLPNGNCVLENVYIDMENWYRAYNHHMFGGIFGICSGNLTSCTITNVTLNGRYAAASTSDEYNYSYDGDGSACGLIVAHGNGKAITISNFLFCGVAAEPRLPNDSLYSYVHHGANGVTGNGTAKKSYQSSNPGSWTDKRSTIGTWTPSSVSPAKYITPAIPLSISNYSNTQYYHSDGAIFTIGSKSEFDTFVTKMNADTSGSRYGRGFIFKLTANIDYGGETGVKNYGDGTTVTFPSAASNITAIDRFDGVLDGQGHSIKNVISKRDIGSYECKGGLIDLFGGTIKNIAFINCFFLGNVTLATSSNNEKFGGLIGQTKNYSSTISNIILASEIWIKATSVHSFGGVIGLGAANCTITDLTFAGRMARANGSNIVSYPGGCPTGFICGNCNSYTLTLNNALITCDRHCNSADAGGSDKATFFHWGNGNCSVSNLTMASVQSGGGNNRMWTSKQPTSGLGSTYKYLAAVGGYVLSANYDTFASNLNSTNGAYTQKMWAQAGTSSDRVRLAAKITKSMAQSASAIGFYLYRSDTEQHATVSLGGVYKSITANGNTYTASSLDGNGDYIMALAIKDFPTGVTLTIQPYVTVNGTTYYGTSVTYSR